MQVMPRKRRPIITLTSDFGLQDHYVAAMKAVLLRHCSDAHLIDLTHQIPRHDVLCGSIMLERAVASFPPGTIHLAVVDPGVGTHRRILVVKLARQTVVCPDNGLITWAWRLHQPARAYRLEWRPRQFSQTFHGRDIMAPVAGKLAAGATITALAKPIDDPVFLDLSPASGLRGQIIYIDSFGNAVTNVLASALQGVAAVKIKGRHRVPVKRTYQDVAPGRPLALVGSSGLLEIAVCQGHAADLLKLKVGDPLILCKRS